jgi:hypothetical protein
MSAVRRTVSNVRRRLAPAYRRVLDAEAARIRRRDAVDAVADAAATLAALRDHPEADPIELVVAESRLETARKRFWAMDAELRELQPEQAATG